MGSLFPHVSMVAYISYNMPSLLYIFGCDKFPNCLYLLYRFLISSLEIKPLSIQFIYPKEGIISFYLKSSAVWTCPPKSTELGIKWSKQTHFQPNLITDT